MTRKYRLPLLYTISLLILVALFFCNIFFGSVAIDFEQVTDILLGNEEVDSKIAFIIQSSRIPQAITAMLAGAALAVSGLLLQTLFRNPLASPSILGISSGAGMGVAFATLIVGGPIAGIGGNIATVTGAILGAGVVLFIILLASTLVRNNILLLIIGMMISYLATSVVSLLSFYSSSDAIASYVLWGMGDFSSVSPNNLPLFTISIIIALLGSILLIKPLDSLLLGERYAENLGTNILLTRVLALIITGILAAIVTAYCGPVSFIGLAVPHLARLGSASSSHNRLIPLSIVLGSCTALLCNLLTVVAGDGTILPINVITPMLGAPVVLYVILNRHKNMLY